MTGRARVLLLCILALTSSLSARVLSYAPYTNRTAIASLNHRNSRWFALTEDVPNTAHQQVVLYDALGFEEPRVIYDADTYGIAFVALYENRFLTLGPGPINPLILIATWQSTTGGNAYQLSIDGGKNFTRLSVLDNALSFTDVHYGDIDYGGPYARGLSANAGVVIGDFYPFVLSTNQGIYVIDFAGNVKLLLRDWTLVGRNRDGSRLLVRNPQAVAIVDVSNGLLLPIGPVPAATIMNGWITDEGDAYVQPLVPGFGIYRYLYFYHGGERTLVGAPMDAPGATSDLTFFAVPTSDYNGAWMIKRQTGKPTTLLRHTITTGVETLWSDVSGPEVEALHTAGSSNTLLIQVHRRRVQVQQFIDPALAVWHVGEPAPKAYDELYLNETPMKGFVHLDVDHLADGAPFVFDSGAAVPSPILSGGGAGGGGDVVQEWGIVRGSVKQRLVLPGIARQAGAYGSYWLTDVVVHNPLDEPQNVDFRFAAAGVPPQTAAVTIIKTVTLAPKQIAVYSDVMKSLFDIDSGGGAVIIEPKVAVTATARTYTRAANGGAFGFGMQAIDYLNATSPRFPVTFAGAFPGAEFRTNMLLTDTSGRGTEARLRAQGFSGFIGADDVTFSTPANGVQQMNGIGGSLGLTQNDSGGLTVQPARGSMIATVVAMDNRTNDPTFFPPDLPTSVTRVIPAIGHVDGANNSKFRSDLYLLNPSSMPRTVFLEAKRWDFVEAPLRASLTLVPGEARVIRDVLPTLFGVNGIARLRVTSPSADGVRVTSRTYSVNDEGGTFGCLVPPLNSFQSAGAGEQLEILGITADSGSRTNLGLVEVQAAATGPMSEARIHIVDDTGKELDAFTVQLPPAGGMQINNLFESRGIAQPKAAIVYVEVIRGGIGAYVTTTDNVTNDSTYLGASLSARPN